MRIIKRPNLELLDRITDQGESSIKGGNHLEGNDVQVSPTIKDVGDVGIKTGIRF